MAFKLTVSKRELNDVVSKQPKVRATIGAETALRGSVARARLRARQHDGHSHIDTIHAAVDGYIVLDDERGAQAAAAIEYGRSGYEREVLGKDGKVRRVKVAGTKGVGALQAAMRV